MTDPVVPMLKNTPNGGLRYHAVRIDANRDTKLNVCRNIDGWPYVTIGDSLTLILHPHFAERLKSELNDLPEHAPTKAQRKRAARSDAVVQLGTRDKTP